MGDILWRGGGGGKDWPAEGLSPAGVPPLILNGKERSWKALSRSLT